MPEKTIDPLALYAGQKPVYPAVGIRVAPLYRAISYLFDKAENTVNLLHSPRDSEISHSNLESNDQLSKRGRPD